MKITKLEAGVYIIEKGQLILKLSKLKSEWVLIYQDQIVGKYESKKVALIVVRGARSDLQRGTK